MLQRCFCFVVLCILVPATRAQPPGQGAVDLLGDPLPDGAVARLGTLRLKHGAVVESMAFSPDGRILASKSGKRIGSIRLWDMATGKHKLLMANVGKTSGVSMLMWSPDGRSLAVAGRRVQIWELASLKVRREIFVYANALDFSPNGRFLATAGMDTTVLVWDLWQR